MCAMHVHVNRTFALCAARLVTLDPLFHFACHLYSSYNFLLSDIRVAVKSQAEQLCNEVAREGMGMQDEQWDLVAQRMNEFMCAKKIWWGTSCIFDGRMCHFLFRTLVVEPANVRFLAAQRERTAAETVFGGLLNEKEKESDGLVEECEEEDSQATMSTADRATEFALKSYKSSIREWWNARARNEKADGYGLSDGRLPKETFRSLARWKLSVTFLALIQSGKFLTIFIFSLLFFELNPFTNTAVRLVLAVLLSNVLCGFVFTSTIRDNRLNANDYMELWATIVAVEPRGDTSEWDRVASHMNKYLVTASAAGRAAQFYDGKDCMQRFKKRYSASLLKKKRWGGGKFEDLRPYIEAAMDAASED
ncbi:hypothetical protein ACU8KH_00789 [Lachancea thermotolerans]